MGPQQIEQRDRQHQLQFFAAKKSPAVSLRSTWNSTFPLLWVSADVLCPPRSEDPLTRMQALCFRGRIISPWPFLSDTHDNCSTLGLHGVRMLVMKCFHSLTLIILLHYWALPQGPSKESRLSSFPAETKIRPPNKLHLLKFLLPPWSEGAQSCSFAWDRSGRTTRAQLWSYQLTHIKQSSEPVASQKWQRLLPSQSSPCRPLTCPSVPSMPQTQHPSNTASLLPYICYSFANADHRPLLCKKLHFSFDCLIPCYFFPSWNKRLASSALKFKADLTGSRLLSVKLALPVIAKPSHRAQFCTRKWAGGPRARPAAGELYCQQIWLERGHRVQALGHHVPLLSSPFRDTPFSQRWWWVF